ncbi:MAG TPA: cupin domain-containing protein [Polyangiaceae bacterium]|nr:cupin domain-containing protein [Polyangiaceae bacterium]
MSPPDPLDVQAAEVVLPCAELDETLAFFTERLGFRVRAIFPADGPRVAVLAGHGLRLRLERGASGDPGRLRLLCRGAAPAGAPLRAPNGTLVELAPADPPLSVPDARPSFVVSRAADGASWQVGRATMRYRDLVPDRQGGRFIASHIRIPTGGPVPDYVHFHKVRFQMIYGYRGWSRLVYEDQGEPFVLRPGDCVLQPPEIRHRVLECSPGHEVIEVGCPAEHETFADPATELPTAARRPSRDFGGQRFVRHVAADASWQPFRLGGFECRDTGIAAATGGLAGVRVARRRGEPTREALSHDAEFLLHFVLEGALTLRCEGEGTYELGPGDCFVVPPGRRHALEPGAGALELLEVALPAAFTTTRHPGETLADE